MKTKFIFKFLAISLTLTITAPLAAISFIEKAKGSVDSFATLTAKLEKFTREYVSQEKNENLKEVCGIFVLMTVKSPKNTIDLQTLKTKVSSKDARALLEKISIEDFAKIRKTFDDTIVK